ncbi:hypothetical protein L1987_29869 [Smallanthus sonchifolius]|uniref:Uncharacterized protein n=1 Tax=Smallanthus sonchifolius TaxID=185202 RepID=A0ACB9I302_9ASTR|nr:hypothetical protein L1987_29869 [Smallanthus sonchifolius]
MASSPGSRERFISSTIHVARQFGFDGVVLDWEYPQTQTDMDNFGLLLDEWRVAVNQEALSTDKPKLFLSAATYYKLCNRLQSWINVGIQREKLIMGLPLYGRTWKLQDPNVDGIRAPAVGLGPGNDGAMLYSRVLEFNAQNNAKVVFDVSTVSYYSVAGTSWIEYDDVKSVKPKIEYAQSLNIGGYFFWTVVGDQDWKISQLGTHFVLSFL